MNRRNFLSLLAAGLTFDPERLLWRPGAKLISIPKVDEVPESLLDEISVTTLRYLRSDPSLLDFIFKYDPVIISADI